MLYSSTLEDNQPAVVSKTLESTHGKHNSHLEYCTDGQPIEQGLNINCFPFFPHTVKIEPKLTPLRGLPGWGQIEDTSEPPTRIFFPSKSVEMTHIPASLATVACQLALSGLGVELTKFI